MMKKLMVVLAVLTFFGCKKEYTCNCTTPGGTTQAFTVKDTRKDAEAQCTKFYNDNFAHIPLNETTCEVK